jgi:hypothetical protein
VPTIRRHLAAVNLTYAAGGLIIKVTRLEPSDCKR